MLQRGDYKNFGAQAVKCWNNFVPRLRQAEKVYIFYRLRPIEPRYYDDGALGMRPDGLVFPCCSPVDFDTCLHLGNIRKKSLSDMLSDNPCVDLCNLLQDSESFQKLTSIAVEKGLLTAAQRDISPCEQCNLMFRKKGYDVLKKYAADLYEKARKAFEYPAERSFPRKISFYH